MDGIQAVYDEDGKVLYQILPIIRRVSKAGWTQCHEHCERHPKFRHVCYVADLKALSWDVKFQIIDTDMDRRPLGYVEVPLPHPGDTYLVIPAMLLSQYEQRIPLEWF